MKEEKLLIQKPGGVVLKALQELSGEKKVWVSLKNIYGFIDSFFGYVANNEHANDLAAFHDAGWIKSIDYIPSLGKFVYLTGRGRRVIEKGDMPEYAKHDFYDSINKARNSAL